MPRREAGEMVYQMWSSNFNMQYKTTGPGLHPDSTPPSLSRTGPTLPAQAARPSDLPGPCGPIRPTPSPWLLGLGSGGPVDLTLAHCRSHGISNNSGHIGPLRFLVSDAFVIAHEETHESRFPWANVEVDVHIGSRESKLNGVLMGHGKTHDFMRTSMGSHAYHYLIACGKSYRAPLFCRYVYIYVYIYICNV
jgi:hypothetical protein